MEVRNCDDPLSSELPKDDVQVHLPEKPDDYVKSLLLEDLPPNDRTNLDTDLRWNFILEEPPKPKKKKNKRPKYLSRKERLRLGMIKLPSHGWSYARLEKMRSAWMDYITDVLEGADQLGTTIGKCEFVGADVEIVRSKAPGLVGMRGTVVAETKGTFQIVTAEDEFKVLLKAPSLFCVRHSTKKFLIFGKHLVTRPGERSVKKIKNYMVPDL